MSKGSKQRPGTGYAEGYGAIDWGKKDAPEQALQELADSSQELGAYDAIVFADEEPAEQVCWNCKYWTGIATGVDAGSCAKLSNGTTCETDFICEPWFGCNKFESKP